MTRSEFPIETPAGWFLLGFLLAVFLQWTQAAAIGGGDLAVLVSVGEASAMRGAIERELIGVPLVSGDGHDGQTSYLVARHPRADHPSAALMDHAAYRFRRILYPLLAGAGGLLGPQATVYGLAAWAALGMGLSVMSAGMIARRIGVSTWALLGALINPGLWLSVRLLTPDALAAGLALTGVAFWLARRRIWALAWLAAAVLTKESYLLVVAGLAGWAWREGDRRASLVLGLSSALPCTIWSAWLTRTAGGGFSPRGTLSFPLAGLITSAARWGRFDDMNLSLLTLASLLIATLLAISMGNSLLAWLTWPWVAVAVASSSWVWDLGNNSARAFLPLWVLASLSIAARIIRRERVTASA